MSTPPLAGVSPLRLVLPGVPKINFYEGGPRCPEDLCIPAVLRALGEYFNEDAFGCKTCRALPPGCAINCSYAFFVGVTGVASFLSWKKGWADSQAAFYMSADPEAPERWGCRALGYAFTWVNKKPAAEEPDQGRERFRRAIVESIQKGRPVVAYGVVGPPEPALIAGYDEGGDVLIGWSFFQAIPDFAAGLDYEPEGLFRKRDWFEDTACLLLIGERQERPPLKQIVCDALGWMVKVARTPAVRPEADAPEWYQGRANGLAAYGAWAESLLADEDYPAADEAALRKAFEIHNNSVGQVAEARWYGAQFLLQAANPDFHPPLSLAEGLYHAAAYYAAEHDLMWELWNLAGGNGSPDGWKYLADPAARRRMAEVILRARDKDAQAVAAIEDTLARWK